MHWCANETMALMAMIPILGYLVRKIQVWYHMKFKHGCHDEKCQQLQDELECKDCHESKEQKQIS